MMSSLFQLSHRRSLLANSNVNSEIEWQEGGRNRKLVPPPMSLEGTHRLPKLLLKVTIEGSTGPVQVLMSLEHYVGDLVKAVVDIYVKEKRRPLLHKTDYRGFDLHYSQFSLESLNNDEILINLGSRNFYLCKKP